MSISVLIPTYRRPTALYRCLHALKEQTRPADQVLVTVRDTDEQTRLFLGNSDFGELPIKTVTVSEPGVVAAMNAGLAQAHGDILAITDDDTVPYPDWLERIEEHFSCDPKTGGVGGRDWLPHDRGKRRVVGKMQWYGRIIGNHHLGVGKTRTVDFLKGANCAYRTDILRLIGFDTRLRGEGAQVHWEIGIGLPLRRLGYKLIYDPKVQVDHYPAQRYDDDQLGRGKFVYLPLKNAVHNETYLLLRYLSPVQRIAYLLFFFLAGTRAEPGILQLIRLWIQRQAGASQRYRATLAGGFAGIYSFLLSKYEMKTIQVDQFANSQLS